MRECIRTVCVRFYSLFPFKLEFYTWNRNEFKSLSQSTWRRIFDDAMRRMNVWIDGTCIRAVQPEHCIISQNNRIQCEFIAHSAVVITVYIEQIKRYRFFFCYSFIFKLKQQQQKRNQQKLADLRRRRRRWSEQNGYMYVESVESIFGLSHSHQLREWVVSVSCVGHGACKTAEQHRLCRVCRFVCNALIIHAQHNKPHSNLDTFEVCVCVCCIW